MTINVQAVNFNAKPGLEEYLDKKLTKLETLSDKIISAQVFLKLDNTSDKVNKIVEIKLEVPGAEIRVPLFINEGDKVKINTEDGSYVERVKE